MVKCRNKWGERCHNLPWTKISESYSKWRDIVNSFVILILLPIPLAFVIFLDAKKGSHGHRAISIVFMLKVFMHLLVYNICLLQSLPYCSNTSTASPGKSIDSWLWLTCNKLGKIQEICLYDPLRLSCVLHWLLARCCYGWTVYAFR